MASIDGPQRVRSVKLDQYRCGRRCRILRPPQVHHHVTEVLFNVLDRAKMLEDRRGKWQPRRRHRGFRSQDLSGFADEVWLVVNNEESVGSLHDNAVNALSVSI